MWLQMEMAASIAVTSRYLAESMRFGSARNSFRERETSLYLISAWWISSIFVPIITGLMCAMILASTYNIQ